MLGKVRRPGRRERSRNVNTLKLDEHVRANPRITDGEMDALGGDLGLWDPADGDYKAHGRARSSSTSSCRGDQTLRESARYAGAGRRARVLGKRPLYVPLGADAQTRLRELATAERRSPRQQAAIILERALGLTEPPNATRSDGPMERSPQGVR